MTVKELIALLQKFPLNQKVFVRSYENGFDPVYSADLRLLKPNTSEHWYEGRFQTSDGAEKKSTFEGVIMYGDQRSP